MGTPVTFAGLSVVVPENNDQGWGSDVSALLIQLATFAATNTALTQASRIVTATPDTALVGDFALGVNVPSASVINLPSGSGNTGKLYVIYDFSGAARTNPITITPAGADTINGAASYIINANNAVVWLQYTGTQWSIVASHVLSLFGPQLFNQLAANTSYVVSATLPTKTLPTVTNGQSSSVTFSGSNAYLFSVSLGNSKSFVAAATFNGTNITALSDPDGVFLPTNSGTGIYVSKSAGSGIITFTNNLGVSTTIEVKSLTTDLVSPTAWS